MEKDITVRIDELISFFVKPGSMSTDPFKGLTGELSMLYSKVIAYNNLKPMQAVKQVIKDEGLNKNWAKKLKQYVKAYA